MGRIFISYRRTDSADQAGRVFDRLVAAFGKASVFKDVDSVPAGSDFRRVIEEAVMKSETVVLLIGPSWLSAASERGRLRLDDMNDFVRLELESALRLGKLIIPVLVRGGAMPRPDELPESIRDVAFRHAVPVRPDPDFHRDMDRLIQAIKARKAEKYQPKQPPQAGTSRRTLYAAGALGFLASMGMLIYAFSGSRPTAPTQPQAPAKSYPDGVPYIDTNRLPIPQAPSKMMPEGYIPAAGGTAPAPGSEVAHSSRPMPSPQSPIFVPPQAPTDSVPPEPVPPAPGVD